MKKITKMTTIEELAAFVCTELHKNGIDSFLSGGAVVSIYTKNEYESYDLDFISHADRKKIKKIMIDLGFNLNKTRHFTHPNTKIFVEFPGSALKVGDSLITEFSELKNSYGTLKLLTPTDCVLDRLAAYFHWNDLQSLDQAVAVSKNYPVNIKKIKKWAHDERMEEKLNNFLNLIKLN